MGRTLCYSVERWANISVWYVELTPGYEPSLSDVICSPDSNSVLRVLHVVQETCSIPFDGRRLLRRLWTTERHPHTRNTPRRLHRKVHLFWCLDVVARIQVTLHVTFNRCGLAITISFSPSLFFLVATVRCQEIPRLPNQSDWLSRNFLGKNFIAQSSTRSVDS